MMAKSICVFILGIIVGKIPFLALLSFCIYKQVGFNRGEPNYEYRNKFWEWFYNRIKISPWGYFE